MTVEDLAAVTQDTTGSSINTFDPVEVIYQNPCNGHISQLYMKHGVENCDFLEEAIQEIHDIVVILRRGAKRKEFLQKECEKIDLHYKKPILDGKTRWNSREAMIDRFIYLRQLSSSLLK